MATAIEAPASTTAEGPTSHTLNQAARFTAPQLRLLHRGVDPKRIGQDDKGFSHMEAWDIKRYLLRVFGFAGYDTENRELSIVREIEIPQGGRSRWTVVYRAQVRLTVKDVHGNELGHWDGEAAGGATNLPSLADAHDMAMKTASSQALKRAATNLGDQFGLSLYNDGSPQPVVQFSAAHPPTEWEASKVPELNDPPVRGEPTLTADSATDIQGRRDDGVPTQTASAPQRSSQQLVLAEFQRKVHRGWNSLTAMEQSLAEARTKALLDEVVPVGADSVPTRLGDLLQTRIDQLKATAGDGSHGRSAA
ncbi:Rad52/Rad22 family DNA repair protein [Streptomyces sp. DH12]|uniref:Rad52/Rad22 family DNA repair protein n=1 Tax=Streptomyces sp. DH12 TaxID=2857010 RepID=UPI001E46EB21|nr:Rad52/Rad22 family DNA repair protein [Streptomyces sp. DH12]